MFSKHFTYYNSQFLSDSTHSLWLNTMKCIDLAIFPYFLGPKCPISRKGWAIAEFFENFKKSVIFTLFGVKVINERGCNHNLKIAPKNHWLTPTPSIIQTFYKFLYYQIIHQLRIIQTFHKFLYYQIIHQLRIIQHYSNINEEKAENIFYEKNIVVRMTKIKKKD